MLDFFSQKNRILLREMVKTTYALYNHVPSVCSLLAF